MPEKYQASSDIYQSSPIHLPNFSTIVLWDKVERFRVGTCCTFQNIFCIFKGLSNQFTATANWQLLQKWSMVEMPYLIIFSFIIRCKCKYLTDWVMCQDGTCFLWVLHLFVCFFGMKLFQVRISALQSLLQKWSAIEFDC